ncbi:MAG: glycosyltransferase family 2 protein [Mucilaginibacter sp.]
MDKIEVSVIMPAYNAESYINDAIQSVRNQTFENWELIVVNDGSTDKTATIVDGLMAQDSRIKLVNQENKKQAAARNAGIRAASGIWLAFLDADDLWVPEKLKKQLNAAESYPNAGVIFSDGYTFTGDVTNNLPYGAVSGFFKSSEIYKLEYKGNYIPVLSVLMKKADADKIGPQDEGPYLQGCEDWDYWIRLALDGVAFYGMEEKLFYYRKHASNMSNNGGLMSLANANVFIKNYRKELLSPEETGRLNGFVNRTICGFIKPGKINEALFLNNGMYEVTKGKLRRIGSFIMNKLGRRSYYLIRLVFKIDTLLNYR